MALRDLFQRRSPERPTGPSADGPLTALQIAREGLEGTTYAQTEVRQLESFKRALELSPQDRMDLVIDALRQRADGTPDAPWALRWRLWGVAAELMRTKLPWDDDRLVRLLDALAGLAEHEGVLAAAWPPVGPSVRAVEQAYPDGNPPEPVAAALGRIRRYFTTSSRAMVRRIDAYLAGPDADPTDLIEATDPWHAELLAVQSSLDEEDGSVAGRMLALARRARSAKPPKAFLGEAAALTGDAGDDVAGRVVGELLSRSAHAVSHSKATEGVPPETGDLLRGLRWIAGTVDHPDAARGLGAWAHRGWQKVPGHGPLSKKAASAALQQLPELVQHGPAQLGRVRSMLKQPTAVEEADRAIDRAADALGIDRAEFEERVVPTYGLVHGRRDDTVGEHAVRLALGDDLKATLAFTNAKGKPVKTAPAALKRDHDVELKALKAEAKDLTVMAGAQRLRLERLLLEDRTWPVDAWRSRYVDHGLVGVLARRLVWTVADAGTSTPVIGLDGELVDVTGTIVSPAPSATVSLWHPVDEDADDVMAWRRFLEDRRIVQPFKQAHREVYLLTDAERTTDIYSNRFAAHVLRQHQFAALARGRGWRYALQGAFDSPDEYAELPLPGHGVTAGFWVDRPWGDDGEEDWNDSGIFNHVLSDQVRFLDAGGEPVKLDRIPARVLSEVLRDVDLFVGVGSIGNDPSWQDGGPHQRFDRYWTEYSFGDLGEQAKIRRDLLERLLPRLAIGDVSRIDGRWLVVQGHVRTYRIHLGSGNIQMEPNNEYLCIVPGRRDENPDVFLPFDGDRVLSIVLSKAMMLADDTSITDETILSQIRR